MSKKRKTYSPEEKVRLLKEHLVNGVAVSRICEENGLQPTVLYRWQRQFFEQGASAFRTDQNREKARLEKKIARLEEKIARKNEVLGELMEAHIELKKSWGRLSKRVISRKMRRDVVDFVRAWKKETPLTQSQILARLGLPSSKYHNREQRYDMENSHHNPPKYGLQKSEKSAILRYHDAHPDEGYRRLAYIMLDENIVAVSPSSVYRVLKNAGKLQKWAKKPSKKGRRLQTVPKSARTLAY